MSEGLLEVARIGEVAPGRSKKFLLAAAGREVECFLVNWKGGLYAYVNRCRHVPMTMDWIENRFFDEDGDLILCPTHASCYAPDTGECVAGPAYGKSLIRVPLEVRDGVVYARAPDDFEDVL